MKKLQSTIQGIIIKKSRLLLQANALEKAGQGTLSKELFRRVAQMEEGIAQKLRAHKNKDWHVNALSAASCWVKSGDLSRARENFCLVLSEAPEQNINQEILWFLSDPTITRIINERSIDLHPQIPATRAIVAQTPQIHLFTIGIDVYDDKRFPSLYCASNDTTLIIEAWDSLMTLSYSGTIISLRNSEATREGIYQGLARFQRITDERDFLLIHFCGHGATSSDGRKYFVTWDTRIDQLEQTGLSLSDFAANCRSIPVRQKLVVFDSTFAGRGEVKNLDFSNATNELAKPSSWKGFVDYGVAVLAACPYGQKAHESRDLGHGLLSQYTAEWLKALPEKSQKMNSLRQLHQFVLEKVRERSMIEFSEEQQPFFEAQLTDDYLPTELGASFERWRYGVRMREALDWITYLVSRNQTSESEIMDFFVSYPLEITDEHYEKCVVSPILLTNKELELAPDLVLGGGSNDTTLLVSIIFPHMKITKNLLDERVKRLRECRKYLQTSERRNHFKERYGFSIDTIQLALIVNKKPRHPITDLKIITYGEIVKRFQDGSDRFLPQAPMDDDD